MPDRRASLQRLALWTAFVVFCTVAMVDISVVDQRVPVIGKITYYQALIALAALYGAGVLLRRAGDARPTIARTATRIVIAYLLFEVFAVIPVAVWLGTAPLKQVVSEAAVRFTWLLFPVMLALGEQARRRAGAVVAIAAVALTLWGAYLAVTGGGGYYSEYGDLRFRILYGGATLLFAWPFALSVSGAVTGRWALVLFGTSLIGLVFTNHRSGFIAFAVAGIACLLMTGRYKRLVPWLVPAAVVGIMVMIFATRQVNDVFGYTVAHLFDVRSGNGADRLMRWRLAFEYVTSRPINDYVWSWRYYLVNLPEAYQPHNFLLEIGATEGLAGLLFYGTFFSLLFSKAAKWVRADGETRALVGYLIAYLVFCFANASWYLAVNYALMVGAIGALVARMDELQVASGDSP